MKKYSTFPLLLLLALFFATQTAGCKAGSAEEESFVIKINGNIDSQTASRIRSTLFSLYTGQGKRDITLDINCQDADPAEVVSICEVLEAMKDCRIRTICTDGNVAAGTSSLLLCMGSKGYREIGEKGLVMTCLDTAAGNFGDLYPKIEKILLRHSAMTAEEIRHNFNETETWLLPEVAIRYGLADTIRQP